MRDQLDLLAVQPVPARSSQVIEFTFGAPYRVQRLQIGTTDDAYPIALIGAQTHRRVNLLMSGTIDAFIIIFEPGGFSALFSTPAAEVTDQDVDARSVLGRELARMHQRLGDVETFEDRVAVADQFLAARLARAVPATLMAGVAKELHRRSGRVTVAGLASAADLSVRQLERRFRQEIGMPPKLYARVVRFEAALHVKAAQPSMQWTEIAHTLGYFDQMHMVHDFNRLSGESPSLIADQMDRHVKPEVAANAGPP
jgi:AraC-like DNA-binding protein